MADFCKQCSIELFGHDSKDFVGPYRPLLEDIDGEQRGYVSLCEGCGFALTDHTGRCIAIDCDKQHGLTYNILTSGPKL